MTVAGKVRRARMRPCVRQLPMDCPYCWERLRDAPGGWMCCRCRSTIGTARGIDLIEEGLS
jgi:hypothetical protein